jgi:hypothetical protein
MCHMSESTRRAACAEYGLAMPDRVRNFLGNLSYMARDSNAGRRILSCQPSDESYLQVSVSLLHNDK